MFRNAMRTVAAGMIAAGLAACSARPAGEAASAEMVTDPTEIVASVVLPSKVVDVDPPKRFDLTFRNDRGDSGSFRVAKRCRNWRAIPVGTVRRIRWTTYRQGDETWTQPSDDGDSIRNEFCR